MDLPTPEAMERVLLEAIDLEPDAQVIDRPGWKQVRTPSSPRPNHNKVVVARLRPDDADAAIAKVVDEHAARDAAFEWIVGPSSSPSDLGARLSEAGLQLLGPSLGMARVIGDEALPMDVPGLTVHEMTTAADVERYADVTAAAWERDEDFRERIAYIGRKCLSPAVPTRSFIASIDGEPVASSHLRLLPGCGYLQGCAVLASRRRQGIYRALVHHRLAALRDAGIRIAVIFAAANTSGQGCRQLGFSTVCTADFYGMDG